MPAPIPSFFKLRLGLVAICFLLFFMFLGFVRDVFAVDCSQYSFGTTYYKTAALALAASTADTYPYSSQWTNPSGSVAEICFGIPVGFFFYKKYDRATLPQSGNNFVVDPDCIDDDGDGECECRNEREQLEQDCPGDWDKNTCECNDPCVDQKEDAAFECGEDNYTIDEQCYWECKCSDSCSEQCAEAQNQCPDGEYSVVDEETCSVKCKDCTDEAAEQCGGAENVEWTEDGDCSYNCKRPCEDEQDQLAWECGGTDQYTIDTETCDGCCITADNHDCDDIPDDQDDDDDNDGKPDGDDPCPQNPDPNCTAPDSDGDGDPDDKDDDDDNDGMPDDSDPCPQNPDPNCTAPDADGDGTPDKDDPCPDNPNPDCAPGDSNGDGSPDPDSYLVKEQPYTVAESDLANQFTTRWTQFVGEIKQTSFFSIPDQVFGGFSSGSESASISIEGGETFGDHEVDFSGWSSGLAALRAVLYAVFGVIAVRIVTLKR